jgi:hypothetical protein
MHDDDIEAVDVIELPGDGFDAVPPAGGRVEVSSIANVPGAFAFYYGPAGPYSPEDVTPPVDRWRIWLAAWIAGLAEWVESVAEWLDEWRCRIDPSSGPLW